MSLAGQRRGAGADLSGGVERPIDTSDRILTTLKRNGVDVLGDPIVINKKAKFMKGINIPTDAGSNKVLVSDASGNATWDALDVTNFDANAPPNKILTSNTDGEVEWADKIKLNSGSAAATSLSFDTPSTGIYASGPNELSFSQNGLQRVKLESNGYVSQKFYDYYAYNSWASTYIGPNLDHIVPVGYNPGVGLNFRGPIVDGGDLVNYGGTSVFKETGTSGEYKTRMLFSTASGADVDPDNIMIYDSKGHLGINLPRWYSTIPTTLYVNGSFSRNSPVIKDDDFVVLPTENWIICNATKDIYVTLPDASVYVGRELMLKNINLFQVFSMSANVVDITGTTPSTTISSAFGDWKTFVSNGTNWVVMATNNSTTVTLSSDNTSGSYLVPFAKNATGSQNLYTDGTTTPLTYNPALSTLTCDLFSGMATVSEKSKVLTTSDNTTHHITIVKGNGNREIEIDSDLTYNPSTNILSASTFNGNLTGNASTATSAGSATNATNATNIALASDNTAGTYYIPFSKTSTGNNALYTDVTTGPLTYNPSTSTLTCSTINATTVTSSSLVKGYFYYYNTVAFVLAAVDTLPINGSNVSGTFNYVTELGIEKIVIPNSGYYAFEVYYLLEKAAGGLGDSYLNIVINDVVQPLYGRFNRVEHADNGWSINYNVRINCNANSKVWFNHFHSASMNLVSKTVNASGITTCPAVQIYASRIA